jgi:2-methylcitrate dehydratase PrpD
MAQSVAELLVERVAAVSEETLPPEVRSRCEDLLIDVAGLCVAARSTDYVRALIAATPALSTRRTPR